MSARRRTPPRRRTTSRKRSTDTDRDACRGRARTISNAATSDSPTRDAHLMTLMHALAAKDDAAARRLLAATPSLATARLAAGATRAAARSCFLDAIGHYAYAGDTALHVAAAAHRHALARALVARGADVDTRNRRGASPLHYAADGNPDAPSWNPDAQAATVALLIAAGADPNAVDKCGVTPLHRAVRNRCAAAVQALLDGGADASRTNGNGSTPMQLATMTTGRGGSGSSNAKEQQQLIGGLLQTHR